MADLVGHVERNLVFVIVMNLIINIGVVTLVVGILLSRSHSKLLKDYEELVNGAQQKLNVNYH